MSTHAMESALWDMHHDPARVERFHSDPDLLLKDYPLTPQELQLVKSLDVRAMADLGADQMLLFTSWIALSGFDQVGEYMRRMNTPPPATA
ncbi:hypothetical protein [uncultured Nevskia sp.]|uniref:hypothetical protein n=1 Tax=uncultured Nevskia sp. TaxID=228950 RepID=UPI0025D738DB|nr:hypothetical protein [uncultured Nevskia sp.]